VALFLNRLLLTLQLGDLLPAGLRLQHYAPYASRSMEELRSLRRLTRAAMRVLEEA
jgi:hypothetical protein